MEIQTVKYKSGDIVFITMPGNISAETMNKLKDGLDATLPDGVKSIVLSNGMSVGVLRLAD